MGGLGAERHDESGRPFYRQTTYGFGEDAAGVAERQTTSLFLLARLRHAVAVGRRFDLAVVLGTSSSSWGQLIEAASDAHGRVDEALAEAMLEWCEPTESPFDQDRLDAAPVGLAGALGVDELRLAVVPDARDEPQQAELFRVLASHLPAGAALTLDFTHAYRHLPAACLLCVATLQHTRGLSIEEVVSGVYELRDDQGVAPAVRLTLPTRYARHAEALAAYRADGDPTALAGPLTEGMDAARAARVRELLQRIGHALGTVQLHRARKAASRLQRLLQPVPSDPLAAALAARLDDELRWARGGTGASLVHRMLSLAKERMSHGDPLRAAVLTLEAVALATRGGEPPVSAAHTKTSADARDAVKRKLATASGAWVEPARAGWYLLQEARNRMAHAQVNAATAPSEKPGSAREENVKRVSSLLTDPERFAAALGDAIAGQLPLADALLEDHAKASDGGV